MTEDLEQLLGLSHHTKENQVLPLVIEYLSLVREGYKPAYAMQKMYKCYMEGKENGRDD